MLIQNLLKDLRHRRTFYKSYDIGKLISKFKKFQIIAHFFIIFKQILTFVMKTLFWKNLHSRASFSKHLEIFDTI